MPHFTGMEKGNVLLLLCVVIAVAAFALVKDHVKQTQQASLEASAYRFTQNIHSSNTISEALLQNFIVRAALSAGIPGSNLSACLLRGSIDSKTQEFQSLQKVGTNCPADAEIKKYFPELEGSSLSGNSVVALIVIPTLDSLKPVGSIKPENPEISATNNCFGPDTEVLMASDGEGSSFRKKIKDIKVGELIVAVKDSEVDSFEKNPNHKVVARVAKLFYHKRARIIRIHVDTGALDTTSSHNFFIKGKGWVKVKDLRVGDKLISFSGAELKVSRKERVMRTEEVYNINVENAHTYFVFPNHSSEAVLVHNEKGDFIKTPTTCPLYPTPAPEKLPIEVPTCLPTPEE